MREDKLILFMVSIILIATLSCSEKKEVKEVKESEAKVLAVLGDEKITEEDLQKELGEKLKTAQLKYEQEMYRLRISALDRILEQRLLDKEANTKGVTVARLLMDEVTSKIEGPSNEAIEQYYTKNRRVMRTTLEEATPKIKSYLKHQVERDLRDKFIEVLKEKYKVSYLLDYPDSLRVDVSMDDDPAKGPPDAQVKIVLFSDFISSESKNVYSNLMSILDEYEGKVKLVFRDFPLKHNPSDISYKVHETAQCAGLQGKFWAYIDLLFKGDDFSSYDDLENFASELNLDISAFDECVNSGKYTEEVKKDIQDARMVRVITPPAFFVNGYMVTGDISYYELKSIIERELKRGKVKGSD